VPALASGGSVFHINHGADLAALKSAWLIRGFHIHPRGGGGIGCPCAVERLIRFW
jgi:hypothetical protein